MKRIGVFALLLAAAFLLVGALPSSASSHPGFEGTWQGIDPDLSTVTYTFKLQGGSEGRVYVIVGFDDKGSCCNNEPVRARGIGVSRDGLTLDATFVWWGLRSSDRVIYPDPDTFTYHPESDTVTDIRSEFHRVDDDD